MDSEDPADPADPIDSVDPANKIPLTEEQFESRKKAFIDSISHDAVCALASRFHAQKPCRVSQTAHGSFNVCFFVDFEDDTKWVVRVPIEPAIHDVWTKLQSEVATMRYLQSKTTIPIPAVHGHGRGEKLIDGSSETQAYLILDHVPGRQLQFRTLADSPKEQREHFYSQFIDILADLRTLQFDLAGSLLPDPHGGPEPVVGDLLSITINEFWTAMGSNADPSLRSSTSATAVDYALNHFRLLSLACRLPTCEFDRESAQMEVFASDQLQMLIPKLLATDDKDSEVFVLNHGDLRCGNILVDEHFNIQAVIDWEWASTVPQRLFMPPPWITGLVMDYTVKGYGNRDAYLEFHEVLQSKAASSDAHRQLAEEWDPDLPRSLFVPLARILQHHSTLIDLYFRFIYSHFFTQKWRKFLPQFFQDGSDKNQTLAAEVQRRVDASRRYTDYLKENGLFVPDKRLQEMREWLKKAKALEEKLGFSTGLVVDF